MFKSIIVISILAFVSNFSYASGGDPDVVKSVILKKYEGVWYEIAHAPNFFQRDCLRSVAEYKKLSEASLSVVNTCYKKNNKVSSIKGEAKITDPAVPAKLKVRFNFFARGDYWIVSLDSKYQWVVVSGPNKKSLFILARYAPMRASTLDGIISKLKQRGFNTDELIFDQWP